MRCEIKMTPEAAAVIRSERRTFEAFVISLKNDFRKLVPLALKVPATKNTDTVTIRGEAGFVACHAKSYYRKHRDDMPQDHRPSHRVLPLAGMFLLARG